LIKEKMNLCAVLFGEAVGPPLGVKFSKSKSVWQRGGEIVFCRGHVRKWVKS